MTVDITNGFPSDKYLMCGWTNTTVPDVRWRPMTACKKATMGPALPTPPARQAIDQPEVFERLCVLTLHLSGREHATGKVCLDGCLEFLLTGEGPHASGFDSMHILWGQGL
ncbi:hypothetical protein AB1462_15090 [Pseudomonas sp. SB113]|uniref:hypothetical protein n=1 Tax=Pseudomonas sp. SB113 TaxID=3154123 RepID=UPI00345CB101